MSSLLDILPPAQHDYTVLPTTSRPPLTTIQPHRPANTAITTQRSQNGNYNTQQTFRNRNAQLQPTINPTTNQIDYSQIVKQHIQPGQLVNTDYASTQQKQVTDEDVALPSDEVVEETRQKTAAALNQIVDTKTSALKPSHITTTPQTSTQYIKYTTSSSAGSSERLIKLQSTQLDPLEPPKHKHMRLPAPPSEAPVPILHSPPRKLTAEDQAAWHIPPSISNWKNTKGYIIPLHQRMAADGNNLNQVTINDKFSTLADTLVQAERSARVEIEERAEMLKRLEEYKNEKKEQELRALADRARQALFDSDDDEDERKQPAASDTSVKREPDTGAAVARYADSDDEDADAVKQRDAVRREVAQEVRREMRQENRRVDRQHKLDADGRDISERVALGQAVGQQQRAGGTAMFDSRLFNQAEAVAGGFGADDAYNVYDKPLFTGSSSGQTYKPTAIEYDDDDAGQADAQSKERDGRSAHRPSRQFAGTENTGKSTRTEAVQFEKGDTDVIGATHVMREDELSAQAAAEFARQEQAAERPTEQPSPSSSAQIDTRSHQRELTGKRSRERDDNADRRGGRHHGEHRRSDRHDDDRNDHRRGVRHGDFSPRRSSHHHHNRDHDRYGRRDRSPDHRRTRSPSPDNRYGSGGRRDDTDRYGRPRDDTDRYGRPRDEQYDRRRRSHSNDRSDQYDRYGRVKR